jgi:phosphoglycerate dehydrogenase-like enzyme
VKVLVAIYSDTAAWTMPAFHVDVLRRLFPDVLFSYADNEAAMLAAAADAEVAFTSRLTPAAFKEAAALRWVHSPAAGVGSMLFDDMRASDVQLSNSRGMNARAVAEHALALIFALARRLPQAIEAQRTGKWIQQELSGLPTLHGRTLGIVGLGAIGARLAQMAAGLGLRVIATRRDPKAERPPEVAEVMPVSALSRLLAESDIVVIAAPLTEQTRELIGAAELALMKPTAWLINVARGKLVREKDLAEALSAGRLAGAGLDVFEREPPPGDSPLWGLPNVIMTPHVAGFRDDYWEAAVDLFAENLRRYRAGWPLLNLVDKNAGY